MERRKNFLFGIGWFLFPYYPRITTTDPDSGSVKSSPTNIFKKDVHKINIKGGKQHCCNYMFSYLWEHIHKSVFVF